MYPVIFIMGVSGSGKTTTGKLLSQKTGIPFFDADDLHPASNIKKMKAGSPLTDEDRQGWLQQLNLLAREQQHISGAVIACSALKSQYRKQLAEQLHAAKWVFLKGSYDLIADRIGKRKNHFLPVSILQSQFDTLEEPTDALTIEIDESPEKIAETIFIKLHMSSSFGIIGLGVMGKSLSLNFANKGFSLSLYNRFVKDKEENIAADFVAKHPSFQSARAFDSLEIFAKSLTPPRIMLLMVNAGDATDAVIYELKAILSAGDIIIDGGNSFYKDTERRAAELAEKGIYFIGAGISGGEQGALEGPSIMPGGDANAYKVIQPFLEQVAAKDKQGTPCCRYISKGGSGHFVKMIHNGIEYAEMQLITEVYDLLRNGLQYTPDAIAALFEEWNKTGPGSYLLEITVDILRTKENHGWLLDQVLDVASGKGTGGLAVSTAAELGVPAGMMSAALFARYISAQQNERIQGNELLSSRNQMTVRLPVHTIKNAYQLARMVNHHQGFQIIIAAAEKYNWQISLSKIARIWTNGCIIRSELMKQLVDVFDTTDNLLFHPSNTDFIKQNKSQLAELVSAALQSGFAIPALSEAMNYIHAITRSDSAANLIQAQRDYFGAHTWQRKNDKEGKSFHTDWKKK